MSYLGVTLGLPAWPRPSGFLTVLTEIWSVREGRQSSGRETYGSSARPARPSRWHLPRRRDTGLWQRGHGTRRQETSTATPALLLSLGAGGHLISPLSPSAFEQVWQADRTLPMVPSSFSLSSRLGCSLGLFPLGLAPPAPAPEGCLVNSLRSCRCS